MGFFDIYLVLAGIFLPFLGWLAFVIFQEHRELNYLLKVYAPDAHAEFAKPKHLRGPYPPPKSEDKH